MIPRGTFVGFEASVTIDANKFTSITTPVQPVKSFLSALASDLQLAGLLIVNSRVRKAVGSNQFNIKLVLQPLNQFPSKQNIVDIVSGFITTETSIAPRYAKDPCFVADCGQIICSCTGLTTGFCIGGIKTTCPAVLQAQGIISQSGKNPVNATLITNSSPSLLGKLYCAGASAVKAVTPNWSITALIGAGILGIALLFVFTYGKARSA